MFRIALQTQDARDPVEVSVERTGAADNNIHHAHVNGRHAEVEVHQLGDGEGWLRIGGKVLPYIASECNDALHVWIKGRIYTISVVDRKPRRATGEATDAARSTINAPMPGTVLQVKVEVDDTFEAHQPLIVMESMKMEMTLSAPHAGVVKSINCKEGQLVEMNAILARLDKKRNGESLDS